MYRRPPAQKKSIEEKSIINRVPVYKKKQHKNNYAILHNFFFVCVFSLTVERVLTDQHDSGLLYSTDAVIGRSQPL